MEVLKSKWRKEKFLVNTEKGYDELYIIQGGRNLSIESKDFLGNLDNDASKAVIRKAFAKNKMYFLVISHALHFPRTLGKHLQTGSYSLWIGDGVC